MTDLMDPVPDPDLDQQPIDAAVGQRRATVGLALGSLDDNPDDAARAQQIGQSIGVPGVVVNGDLENYEKQHKAMLAGQILNNNPWLRDYVAQNPIGASVSNDDWGNLDKISQAVTKIGADSAMASGIKAYWDYNANFVKRFVEGSDLFTSPAQEFYQNNQKLVQDHPLVAALFGSALEGYRATGGDRLIGVLSGLIHAGTHAAGDIFDKVTGSDQGIQYAEQLEQTISDPGVQMSLAGIPEAGPFLEAAAQRVGGALSRARPYIDSRVEPPVGIHPIIDQAKGAEAKIDVDNLMNAVTEVQKSSTKERDPNLFANFIRQHTQAEIGISSEAVRKLYGNTVPMPDDGLLGFIPGIQDQLIGAEPTGGDIYVPLADWLAHVEPDVAKQLRDDTRVRRGGMTLNEVKDLKSEEPISVHREQEEEEEEQGTTSLRGSGQRPFFDEFNIDEAAEQRRREIGLAGGRAVPTGTEVRRNTDDVIREIERNLFGDTQEQPPVQAIESHTINGWMALARDDELASEAAMRTSREQNAITHLYDSVGQHVYTFAEGRNVTHEHNHPALRALRMPPAEELEQVSHGEAIDLSNTIRDSAGYRRTEPYKGKVTLERTHQSQIFDEGYHVFNMIGENGEELGNVNISSNLREKSLYVEGINLHGFGYGDSAAYGLLGHSTMRSLLRELKALFPEYTEIGGTRVGGMRQRFHTTGRMSMKFEANDEVTELLHQLAEHQTTGMIGNRWIDFGDGIEVKPTTELTKAQQKISDAVDAALAKMAPKALRVERVQAMRDTTSGRKRNIGGIFAQFTDKLPLIIWAVDGGVGRDAVTNIRHEIIHHLRQSGFLQPKEWAVLRDAAIQGEWIKKYNILKRYHGQGLGQMIEESVAEEFARWHRENYDPATGKFKQPTSLVDRAMMKIGQIYQAIRTALRDALGFEPNFNDIFQRIESGKVGQREDVKPINPRAHVPTKDDFQSRGNRMLARAAGQPVSTAFARTDEPELPGVTRMEDRAPFEEGAIKGMTIRTQRKYMELMAKRDMEDMEFAQKQNGKEIARRQTEEWKANERRIRDQIRPGFEDRPDLAADKFLREGRLYGEKVRGKPRLNGSLLTPGQRAALPKDYVAEHGIHPDNAANLFGYHSGDELVNALSAIHRDRQATGLTPGRYVNHLVDSEVARRMQIEHGDLAQNILSEAQDHVISQTQFDMLHEETLHNAILAGIDTTKSSPEIPFTKQHMEQFARQRFNQLRLGQVSTEAHLRDGLRANELAERALLDNDPTEAFKQKQRQAFAFLYAREAKRLEKVEKRFDRLTKKYSAREPSGVPAEYTNYIHQIMGRFKLGVKRTRRDLSTELEAQGYGTLREFVDHKNGDFGNMQLDDRLYDPSFGKPMDQLTTEEFQAVTNALVTLDKAGRSESKVLREGAAEDRATLVNGMQDQLETFPLKEYSLKGGMFRGLTDLAKKYMTVGIINAETWLNRWDRDDLHGLFNQWLVRPLSAAANREATLGREFGKLYREVGEVKDRDRLVRSPLNDPMSITRSDPDGRPYVGFSRKNIAAMISNAGNEYNWDILTRGHNADPNFTWNWLIHNSTREDWVRAEKLGKVFEQAFEMAQTVYRNIYGVAPPKIELRPIHIDFPNGEKFDSDGWYHPIIRDEKATNLVRSARGEDLLERDKGLFPSIANGYTKRRTGKVDVLSLNHDMVVPRLNQIIHDVAFRSEVIEAAKLVKDPGLRKSIRQYYGEQYVPMLDNWLSDIAGASNIQYGLMSDIIRASNYARTNVIGSLIGFNPGTVLKHGPTALVNSMYEVGLRAFSRDFEKTTLPFLRESMQHLFTSDQDFANRTLKFIFDNSEEIRRRDRNWQETIGGAHKIVEGKPTLRDRMIMWGSKPVAMSDMLSALPTWLSAYKEEFALEGNHGDAVFAGERAVRRAHGSTAITNLPELVRRSGPFGSWLTTLYGFFSTQMQRRAEIAFKANDIWKLAREGELKSAGSNLVKLTPLIFATLIWPTVVEEYVNSIGTDDRRGPLMRLASGAFGGLASSFLYFRDLAHGAVTGQEPSVGMASTPAHDFANVFKEVAHPARALDRNHAAKTVSDFITVFGEATGLAPKQLAKVVRFGMGLHQGTERPQGPADVGVGLMRGTTRRRIER